MSGEYLPMLALADEPAWGHQRVATLPGRCRGVLLASWAANVARRQGDGAVRRVREQAAVEASRLPDDPGAGGWFAVETQIRVTDAIVALFLGGDRAALRTPLIDDVRHGLGRAGVAAARWVGPRRVLAAGPRAYPYGYDRGSMSVESDRRATIIRCEGPAAANPTWRALQVLAVDVAVELAGGTPSTRWRPAGEAAFEVRVAWR